MKYLVGSSKTFLDIEIFVLEIALQVNSTQGIVCVLEKYWNTNLKD